MLTPLCQQNWPDSIDRLVIFAFLASIVLLPIVGYVLTVLDIRGYLRALRGMLIRVGGLQAELPAWVQKETPPCLRRFGLSMPCTEQDVKDAYRRLADEVHPDRGGDIRRFLQLQRHLEQALQFLRQSQSGEPRPSSAD